MPSESITPTAFSAKPGSLYKVIVGSTDEAVETLRERFGEKVKVISVRHVTPSGVAGWFARPRLEVVAQVPEESVPEAITAASVTTEATLGFVDRAPVARREAEPSLPELLRRSGFSAGLIARLESGPNGRGAEGGEKPLHRSLVDLGDTLRRSATSHKRRALPDRAAFFGPAGVGRSTALCKWLAREVVVRRRAGRVLKVEFDRPNPAEALAVFCEAMGLMLEQATPETEVPAAEADFVYLDLPALEVRNRHAVTELKSYLDTQRIEGRVLVLNAAYDLSVLRDAYAAGRDLGATHLVLTHADELTHWGKLWDFLLEGELTPLFLSCGPSLSGDLAEDVIGTVLEKTLPGNRSRNWS